MLRNPRMEETPIVMNIACMDIIAVLGGYHVLVRLFIHLSAESFFRYRAAADSVHTIQMQAFKDARALTVLVQYVEIIPE